MAIYSVESGGLRKVPSTSVAADTLNMLTRSSVLAIRTDTFGIKASDSVLQYVIVFMLFQNTYNILVSVPLVMSESSNQGLWQT